MARKRARGRTTKRRTADEAKEAILAVAEQHLVASGPGGLRLQELAADAGVSHPSILHHFGSREGLVRAVVERAVRRLQEDLVRAVATAGPSPAVLDRVYEMMVERGHARLLAWLALSGVAPEVGPEAQAQWRALVEAGHAAQAARGTGRGRARTPRDTTFGMMLVAFALFGLAIIGPATMALAGFPSREAAVRDFRAWLAESISIAP
jgi:AcrR family transcriptional regulator